MRGGQKMAVAEKILIIGGSSGIGLACAAHAVRQGYRVTLAARGPDRLAKAASSLDFAVETFALDFTDPPAVAKMFAALGRFDHLVLAASSDPAWGAFKDLSLTQLRRAFEGKMFGYFLCAQQALASLRRDGSMTMLAGAASRVGFPGTSGLAAVNGAITQWAQTLAKELAPLRVNVVSPGMVDTPAYDWMAPEARNGMFAGAGAKLPVGRTGRPAEIAAAVLFLISNGFATGALLDIDGGAR